MVNVSTASNPSCPGTRRQRLRHRAMQTNPLVTALVSLALLSACTKPPAPWQPHPVFHDFGMVPHGQVAIVRVPIDFPQDRGAMLPLGYQGSCSCVSTHFVAIGKDGKERVSLGRVANEHAVLPGEKLFLELSLDTRRKEASEQKPVTNAGNVLLTDIGETLGRVVIPISFTFGIEAPVAVSPFAHINFGALPMSQRYSLTLELRPRKGTQAHFLSAKADDPRVRVELRQDGEVCLLDVRVVPDRGLGFGPLYTTITVPTDLPDAYVVPIPVSGQIVGDIEVKPMERISFGRFDFKTPQEGSVIVRDHDTSRPPEFEVLEVRAIVGKDLAQHMETELQPIEGDARSARLVLRYLGTFRHDRAFRGFVELGKRGGGGSVTSIEFVGFSHE